MFFADKFQKKLDSPISLFFTAWYNDIRTIKLFGEKGYLYL